MLTKVFAATVAFAAALVVAPALNAGGTSIHACSWLHVTIYGDNWHRTSSDCSLGSIRSSNMEGHVLNMVGAGFGINCLIEIGGPAEPKRSSIRFKMNPCVGISKAPLPHANVVAGTWAPTDIQCEAGKNVNWPFTPKGAECSLSDWEER